MNDKELIHHLGGPAKLAARLGFEKGGAQRVHNWMVRGIPASIKVQFPSLFLSRRARALPPEPSTKAEA